MLKSYWKKIIVENNHVKDSQFNHRLGINNTTFNLNLSDLTLQDSGEFGFFSETPREQMLTVVFTLRVYGKVQTSGGEL